MNKQLLLFALLGAALIGSTAFQQVKSNKDIAEGETIAQLWSSWKKTYHRRYADPDLQEYRIQVFTSNLEFIKKYTTGTLGITEFFDLNDDEFSAIYLTENFSQNEITAEDIPIDPSTNINWVTQNKVTPVKQQGGSLIISGKAGQTIDLSEQQLVDCCDQSYGNKGSKGAFKQQAFKYILQNPITTKQNYSYKAMQQNCNTSKSTLYLNYTISDYKQVDISTQALAQAPLIQPVAISVDTKSFKYNTGGIFSTCDNAIHNHSVLLVDFQNDSWIVKNSWGTQWGENDYIRLKNGNTCGVANLAFYPIA
ncbi:hypothetical protein ABPG72_002884 [Tetrahymena utriculariae]